MRMSDNKKQFIELILGIRSESNRKSTLQLALQKARRLAGINVGEEANHAMFITRRSTNESGVSEIVDSFFAAAKDEEMDILTSLCLYLIVLDQLGHIFGPQNTKSNRVKDAIDIGNITANMSDEELNSIKELRNSINHNFGLASHDPWQKKPGKKYTICFNDDGFQKPIIDATEKWDGDWHDKNERTSVHVYPFSLIKYIESVLNSFVQQYLNGVLDSPLCEEELATRFTILLDVD